MFRTCREKLEKKWGDRKFVCVGLDDDFAYERESVRKAVIEATADIACAYKLNPAYYLTLGFGGLDTLVKSISFIRQAAPEMPVILDGKFSDVPHTSEKYADFAFRFCGADAVTVNPYLGQDAVQPFLDHWGRYVFVVCRTSNDGADEFQGIGTAEHTLLYQHVARRIAVGWEGKAHIGLVAGTPEVEDLKRIRETAPDLPILAPAIGHQQEDVPIEKQIAGAFEAGQDQSGAGVILSASRSIFATMHINPSISNAADAVRRELMRHHAAALTCCQS